MAAIAQEISPLLHASSNRNEVNQVIDRMTLAEFVAFSREAEEKYELVNGEAICMSGASPEHNQISANVLFAFLLIFRSAGMDVRVFGSDQKIYVDDRTNLYPDISIVAGEGQFDDQDALHDPFAVIEILSASTASFDQGRKFDSYQRIASLEHYILIDQYWISVAHYAKSAEGGWSLVGNYTRPEESLSLTVEDKETVVSLASIYYLIASAATE